MKISGALKTLLKKLEYHKDNPLIGVIISRKTNPTNYWRAIKIHNNDSYGISEGPQTKNNQSSAPDRLP